MDIFVLTAFVAVVVFVLRKKDEGRRIALLGKYLGQYQVEKLMENLNEGYLRALGTEDASRREQIWYQLGNVEQKLSEQFASFAAAFAKVDEADARVSKLFLPLPWAARFLPAATFDLRKALLVHANGIADAARSTDGRTAKARAFTLSAEMLLMQHTCHWFCRSKSIASARLLVRHKTSYEQVLAAVSANTRQDYLKLTVGRA